MQNNPQRDLEFSSIGEVFCFALVWYWIFSFFKICFIQTVNTRGGPTMKDTAPYGQGKWFNDQEHLLLLQKPGVWIPALISSSS